MSSPDELFIDQHLNHYYFLLKSEYQHITLINTKLPTRRVSGIPPLTCSIPFKQSLPHHLFAGLLWLQYMTKQKVKSLIKRIVFQGIDDQLFIKRFGQKEGIDVGQQRRQNNALHESIKAVPIIHVRPQFLEYDWYKPDEYERFTYYPYRRQHAEPLECTEAWPIVSSFMTVKGSEKRYLIYASLGTLSNLHKTEAVRFFHRLITAVEKLPETYLIVSAGDLYPSIHDRKSVAVSILKRVSQPELLPYCDLMITHGGMNSICECLTARVPMLVFPLNKHSDQPGNAARVVAKGWGLQSNLQWETESGINEKVVKLLTEPEFRRNMNQVKMPPINDWQSTADLAKSK